MNIYAETNISWKNSIIDAWTGAILFDTTVHKTKIALGGVIVDNYVEINPGKSLDGIKSITATLNGVMHTVSYPGRGNDEWLEISPDYADSFLEKLQDIETLEKETHVIRTLFRAMLNEGITWMELYLMLPKCARYLWTAQNWEGWPTMDFSNPVSSDDYQKALQKAIAFSKRNKKSIDVLKQRIFLNSLIKA